MTKPICTRTEGGCKYECRVDLLEVYCTSGMFCNYKEYPHEKGGAMNTMTISVNGMPIVVEDGAEVRINSDFNMFVLNPSQLVSVSVKPAAKKVASIAAIEKKLNKNPLADQGFKLVS